MLVLVHRLPSSILRIATHSNSSNSFTLLFSPISCCNPVAACALQPFMTSTAPTPKGAQEQSLTEKRLQELQAKRDGVVAGGVPERNIQVKRGTES